MGQHKDGGGLGTGKLQIKSKFVMNFTVNFKRGKAYKIRFYGF